MIHHAICTTCQEEDPTTIVWAIGEVNSDLVALCECPKGHKTISGLLHNLFDVLYSSAVDSYIKGCYSESVMSFTASLERTYEMFIKSTLLFDGLDFVKIDSFWDEIKNQSERQYGAFCLQYLRFAKEPWKSETKQVSFRNKVIHKGYIATNEESMDYANYTTELQTKILSILKNNFTEQCRKLYFYELESSKSSVEKIAKDHPSAKIIGTAYPSLLRWNRPDIEGASFSEALEISKKWQFRYKPY